MFKDQDLWTEPGLLTEPLPKKGRRTGSTPASTSRMPDLRPSPGRQSMSGRVHCTTPAEKFRDSICPWGTPDRSALKGGVVVKTPLERVMKGRPGASRRCHQMELVFR